MNSPDQNGLDGESEDHDSIPSTGSPSSPSSPSRSGSISPTPVPEGQYEIERIMDFTKDAASGPMYLVKWKNWEEEFNTWEPPDNLVNCDAALLEFYIQRKQDAIVMASQTEYILLENGKKRRKGPRLDFQVPPDPRDAATQAKEFFEVNPTLTDDEIEECRLRFSRKKNLNSIPTKLNKNVLQRYHDAMDGKLNDEDLRNLRKQLLDIEFNRRRNVHKQLLKNWEDSINSISQGRPSIAVENEVDWAGPPEDFQYINDYVPNAEINIPDDPPVGCSCENGCFDNKSGCCAAAFGAKFAYNTNGRLRVPVGTPIYECNKKCKCDAKCPNRVVQDGQEAMANMQFCIFRTSNGCGWGVKTLKPIKRNSFVTLYVGEVINTEEAERRGQSYDAEGCTYLFDLDFNEQEHCPYTVDAAKFGNIAHFINHSCDPNLAVFAVWVNCLDVNLPKLALFAIYDIPKGTEITFDYKNLVEDRVSKALNTSINSEDGTAPKINKKCLCGSKACREYLF